MSYEAKVVLDSLAPCGERLITFELYYGRAFHQDVMSHAEFARNASSSRAIPWKVVLQSVLDDPWVPIVWGKQKAKMQVGEPVSDVSAKLARNAWFAARDAAVRHADVLAGLGLHKTYPNLLVDPFAHIRVVISGCRWGNFFNQRLHRGARAEFQQLAKRMAEAYLASTPTPLAEGEWHLPYVSQAEKEAMTPLQARRVSAARCARTSYRLHDGSYPTLDKDLALFEELVGGDPKHASPLGHQAMATGDPNVRSGNFRGYVQFRQTVAGTYTPDFDVASRLVEYQGVDYLL